MDTVPATDFMDGLSTWNLDAVNVTDFGFDNRQVAYDGTGVYVAVLDTGLLDSWRQYFPAGAHRHGVRDGLRRRWR